MKRYIFSDSSVRTLSDVIQSNFRFGLDLDLTEDQKTLLNLPVVLSSYGEKGYQVSWPTDKDPPSLTLGKAKKEAYFLVLDAGDHLIACQLYSEHVMLEDRYHGVRVTAVTAEYLKDADYWLSESECEEKMDTWVNIMTQAAIEAATDEGDPDGLCFHWKHGKRRYGLKDNQMNRFFWLLGLDPDGRSRIAYFYPPDYIIAAMQQVDLLVGERLGVKGITNEDLVCFPC